MTAIALTSTRLMKGSASVGGRPRCLPAMIPAFRARMRRYLGTALVLAVLLAFLGWAAWIALVGVGRLGDHSRSLSRGYLRRIRAAFPAVHRAVLPHLGKDSAVP